VARVAQQRDQRKKSAQHVLALGDPRDGFDVHRMPREQRGDECGRPQFAGQPQQQREQQRHVCRVKQGVDEVRPGGIQAEHAAVNHVREPGERMPVAGGHRGESPFHAGPRHAVLHDGLVGNVKAVVKEAKVEPRHRQK